MTIPPLELVWCECLAAGHPADQLKHQRRDADIGRADESCDRDKQDTERVSHIGHAVLEEKSGRDQPDGGDTTGKSARRAIRRQWALTDRKSRRLNSSHIPLSR